MVRCNRNFDVIEFPNDRLELLVVNAIHRLDDLERIFLGIVLSDRSLDRCEVFLVTHIDVVQQGAFPWQKRATDFQRLGVPVLTLVLLGQSVKGTVFLHLDDEPDLSTVAEVTDCEVGNLADERLTG